MEAVMLTPGARHAFVIHGIDHARAVLRAAAGQDRAVALWSAPQAAAYLGAPLFREIINAATAEFPEIDAIGVLDCGHDAGFALAAFRHGLTAIRVHVPPETEAKLADIAQQVGATVLRERPAALDLLDCHQPVAMCRKWLSGTAR